MNHKALFLSNAAVFKLAYPVPNGNGNVFTCSVTGSNRTMAFKPPSVTQGDQSGPTITPLGADPCPRGIWRALPVDVYSLLKSPMVWAVYHTIPLPPPSEEGEEEGATSCGREPKGTGNSLSISPLDGDGDATILEFLNIIP